MPKQFWQTTLTLTARFGFWLAKLFLPMTIAMYIKEKWIITYTTMLKPAG
jgi:hypothetical protein